MFDIKSIPFESRVLILTIKKKKEPYGKQIVHSSLTDYEELYIN